jgi:uncharacterized protein (DUF2252 family)
VTDLDAAWELASRQLANDRARTRRFPALFERKLQRMSASPLAFLRGAAPLFYALLGENKELAAGPGGSGWIVGDLHLENFGAFRTDPLSSGANRTRFDLNDFDDTLLGPWRYDVLRLATSLLLAGREMGRSGLEALALCEMVLASWHAAVFDGEKPKLVPVPVRELIEQVKSREKASLLDARTKLVRGQRRFVRGPRYADLAPSVSSKVQGAIDDYLETLPKKSRPEPECMEVLDAAWRIAGTGSLGGLRIGVLVVGKGGDDGAWIFDMKEQGVPAGAGLLGEPDLAPAERVTTGFRACVKRPPRLMGTTKLGRISMVVRRLTPQEDKLDLKRLRAEDLPSLAGHLGGLLGAAHARAATRPSRARWTPRDLREIRERAVTMAGIHEAVYLALCERMPISALAPG